MGYILKYIQHNKGQQPRYRRAIPEHVREAKNIQQKWFLYPLGYTPKEVSKNYSLADDEYDALIHYKAPHLLKRVKTTYDEYTESVETLNTMGVPIHAPIPSDENFAVSDAFAVEIEEICDKYPRDPATGLPINISFKDEFVINGIHGSLTPPPPTLIDAAKIYIEQKSYDDPKEKKNLQRVERIVRDIKAALGRDLVLEEMKRADARLVLNYYENELNKKPATINRDLNTIRAIINLALIEFDLNNATNPFIKLKPKATNTVKREARRPLEIPEINKITEKLDHAKIRELYLIWILLCETGCRLGEITGLSLEDVNINSKIPHIKIAPNENRGLKTEVSMRSLPLSERALNALNESLTLSNGHSVVFPRYWQWFRRYQQCISKYYEICKGCNIG